MSDDTSTGARSARGERGEPLAELGLPLEELVRRGAREILQRALEAEVEQLLEDFAAVSLMDGRRAPLVVHPAARPAHLHPRTCVSSNLVCKNHFDINASCTSSPPRRIPNCRVRVARSRPGVPAGGRTRATATTRLLVPVRPAGGRSPYLRGSNCIETAGTLLKGAKGRKYALALAQPEAPPCVGRAWLQAPPNPRCWISPLGISHSALP